MDNVSHFRRYLPHELKTRKHVVNLYNSGTDIAVLIRRYKVSRTSIWRWVHRHDGSDDSLRDHSHKPKSMHPRAHTEQELHWIRRVRTRHPEYSYLEIWLYLKDKKGYKRHPVSLYRVLVRELNYKKVPEPKYKPKPYDTPTFIGLKWQMDTKYVPIECKAPSLPSDKNFYQYTVIDECSRKRFLYWYDEATPQNTCDFLLRAIDFFGYRPLILQSDNGFEFTYSAKKHQHLMHPLDTLCQSLYIDHRCIRPRTPRHNGKVERSHRTDNQKFYATLAFYSLADLRLQGHRWMTRYNQMPKAVLGYRSPNEVEALNLTVL